MTVVGSGIRTAPMMMGQPEGGAMIALDTPSHSDFVAPFIFFSSHLNSTIVTVSPSIRQVLGYDPGELVGARFTSLLFPNCPLNEDDSAFRRMELRHGQSVHALRSVRHRDGSRRILSVHAVGIAEDSGGPVLRHHNVVEDVTDNVESYVHAVQRLNTLTEIVRRLSDQETQVAERILRGSMNREIAMELEVSERTIDRRRATILKQMGVRSAAEMVAILVERDTQIQLVRAFRDSHWCQARNAHRTVEVFQKPLA